MPNVCVIGIGEIGKENAAAYSDKNKSTVLDSVDAILQDQIVLQFEDEIVSLVQRDGKKFVKVNVDFSEGSAAHRRQFGGGKGQMIAKAVGVSSKYYPSIFDATAGLGRDAFVLATLGCEVSMTERSPIVRALLANGLVRAESFAQEQQDDDLLQILSRMSLSEGNSVLEMKRLTEEGTHFDVVYLDPMFPERKKSALVKKDMRMFHQVVGEDDDADELLEWAIGVAEFRVVVKRPKQAPFLADKEPSYQLKGKSSRYDVYANKALPG